MLDPNRTVNVGVQVLPPTEDAFPIVDRAIVVIAASGVQYEVGPLETTLEVRLDDRRAVARAAHLACLEAGAERVVTVLTIADARAGATIAEKLAAYRLAAE